MAKNEKQIKENKTGYFKAMKSELKKVTWPTPKELFNNTVAVLVFVIIIALIVFVFVFCFDKINKNGVTKLQEKVQSSYSTKTDADENDENSESSDETNNSEEAEGSSTELENESTSENKESEEQVTDSTANE